MSGQADPVDFSGRMLDLEEDEDLEVFTKVRIKAQTSQISVEGVPLLERCSTIPTCKCLLAENERDRDVDLSADGQTLTDSRLSGFIPLRNIHERSSPGQIRPSDWSADRHKV